jgi:hypothetical protein
LRAGRVASAGDFSGHRIRWYFVRSASKAGVYTLKIIAD